ncbi:hypothetical protein FA95DRAFT_1613683 [Auriscalpium vulgare]|uniref:Uncharacterized protein n=1 Tax=Auriscalpium vulgare TaxID=40419 RepID=A0ACB8R291_9AGAM|nr:hypothetical protein FA95DRAFT_1613683 [Auriscalpium vulgare]
MRDFYTICNPGPGVPKSPPEPKSVPPRVEHIVEDPNAGLTPAEVERLKFIVEAIHAGKLFHDGTCLVSKVGGKDHNWEYWALLQKRDLGRIEQKEAMMEEMHKRILQLAFDRAECDRINLECWEHIAAIKQERMGGKEH